MILMQGRREREEERRKRETNHQVGFDSGYELLFVDWFGHVVICSLHDV